MSQQLTYNKAIQQPLYHLNQVHFFLKVISFLLSDDKQNMVIVNSLLIYDKWKQLYKTWVLQEMLNNEYRWRKRTLKTLFTLNKVSSQSQNHKWESPFWNHQKHEYIEEMQMQSLNFADEQRPIFMSERKSLLPLEAVQILLQS